jgi:hypothetical protein
MDLLKLFFGNLKKKGVVGPDGTEWVDPNAAAISKAVASAAARGAQPVRSTVNGSFGAPTLTTTQLDARGDIGPMRPDVTTVEPSADTVNTGFLRLSGTNPRIVEDTQGQHLTTKGTILRALIEGGLGALAGAGQPSASAGFAAAQRAQQQRDAFQMQQEQAAQESQIRDAQLQSLQLAPAMEAARYGNLQAETDLRKAQIEALKNKPPDVQALLPIPKDLAEQAGLPHLAGHLAPASYHLQLQQAANKPDTVSGAKQDERYRSIVQQQSLGNPVSKDDKAWARSYERQKTLGPVAGATIRLQGLTDLARMPALDTQNNNAPVFISSNDVQSNPDRYIPAGVGAPALTKTALIEDIRGNVQQVRNSLLAMPEFDKGMKAKVAVALRSRDPKSAISSLVSGEAGAMLTPEQQDYLINTALLVENAMAMRSVLGAGQGSEDLRSAITATIPGPTTPTKQYGLKQLAAFEKVLDRLSAGVPNVPLRGQSGTKGGSSPDPFQEFGGSRLR